MAKTKQPGNGQAATRGEPAEQLTLTMTIVGTAPLGFSAPVATKKNPNEHHDEYEERTWRERMHVDSEGHVFLQPSSLKQCVDAAARYRSLKVPGQGQKTYTKYFESGLMVMDKLMVFDGDGNHATRENTEGLRLFVPSDGKSGGGKRVWKTFPTMPAWSTKAIVYIVEPMLAQRPEINEMYLRVAGQYIGLGQYRPQNRGYYGRWVHEDLEIEVTG